MDAGGMREKEDETEQKLGEIIWKMSEIVFFFNYKVLSNHFKRKVQDGCIKRYINTLDKQLKSQRHKSNTVHQSAHTHLHSHTSTHIYPQSPETWLKEQNYRSVGWQARMDEQAGQLEHHRTASVPPIPHIAPPKYPHQKWGLTRARGCKTGSTSLKLHSSHSRGSKERQWAQRLCAVIDTLLQVYVCVCVTLDCSIFLVHTRRLVDRPRNGGVLMSLNFIHPLHSSQIYSQTLPVFAGAWWEKVVYTWLLIGPEGIKEQAAGARVEVKLLFSVVFFIHMGHGLNGKGLK